MGTEANIIEELKSIKQDLEFIKSHMVNRDEIMTPEEEAIHEQGLKEYKEGKTVTLEEFEKEMKSVHSKAR